MTTQTPASTGRHYAGMSLTIMVCVRCVSAAAGLGSLGLTVRIPEAINGQDVIIYFYQTL